jgi:hypothetical protein
LQASQKTTHILVLFTLIIINHLNLYAQEKNVARTMVNAGFDLSLKAVFSPDNDLLCMFNNSSIDIYDVKTGLLIRKVSTKNVVTPENIFFDLKNDFVYSSFYGNPKIIQINLTSGETKYLSKENTIIPELKVKSDLTKDLGMQFITHMYTDKSDDYFYFESPNGNLKLGVKNISSNLVLPLYQVDLFEGETKTQLVDSLDQYSSFKAAFSADSKLLLINNMIYDLETLGLISRINRIAPFGSGASFYQNSNIPICIALDGVIRLDNFKTIGSIKDGLKIIKTNNQYQIHKAKLAENKYWISNYDVKLKKELNSYSFNLDRIIKETSANGKYLLTSGDSFKNYMIVNYETGKVIKEIEEDSYSVAFIFDDNDLIKIDGLNCSRLNIENDSWTDFKLEKSNELNEDIHTNIVHNGIVLKYDFTHYIVHLYSLKNGTLISKFKMGNSKNPVFGFQLDHNKISNELILYKTDNTVEKIDINSGKVNAVFSGHNGIITQYSESIDGTLGLTCSHDGKTTLWDLKTNNKIADIYVKNSENIIIKSPDNYYFSKTNGNSFVHFAKGKKVYPLEQFDLKFNRPDIVLDELGYTNIRLIKAYHKAYLKRLKKMNFTEEMLEDDFHIPEIKIENFEEMPDIEDQGSIDLKLKLEDSKYNLDRINIWINDVSVYGADGISLRDKNIKEYSTTLSVNLANGKNKVQVSVLNQAGAESYKETFDIESSAGKSKPDLYLITIGESEFKQSEYNLTYAAKDANDMATLFQKSKVYGEVKTKTLTNEQASKANILELKSFLADADINDQVMIFVAGHGVLDANLDYFFATYDMDFNNPAEKGLAYEDLESLLDGIAPLKKTLLIDACHSGEIDKDEMELAQNTATETSDVQFRSVGNTAQPKLGMQNTSELTKSLFTDLRKGTGATVISSAGGMEFAMESGKWKNGLFTYVLINGVESMKADINKDGEIWLSEIQEYVSKEVTKLSNGQQQPTSRIENQIVDFRVW